MEYKVLSQRGTPGKSSPEQLEHKLNSHAAEGWRVVSSFTGVECVDPQHLADHGSPRARDFGQ